MAGEQARVGIPAGAASRSPSVRQAPGAQTVPPPAGLAAVDVPEPLHLEDPAALKALGHPLRLRMLTELGMTGPLNVKMLAERLDEPANSVSYHLSQLAAHGLVVPADPPAGSTRRERWWQTASPSGFSIEIDDAPDSITGAALRAWLVQVATDTIDRVIASEKQIKEQGLPQGNATLGAWLTRGEAEELDRLVEEALMFVARRFFAQREAGVLPEGPPRGEGDEERFLYRVEAMFFADMTRRKGITYGTDALQHVVEEPPPVG